MEEGKEIQSKFTTFLNLTAAHSIENIDTARYELSLLNLFGDKSRYLFSIKFILQQISKAMLTLMSDDLSHQLYEKILAKKTQQVPEDELFSFACDIINNADETENTENCVYRFHLDQSTG